MRGREIAGLERLERRKLTQALAGLDEGRVLEAAVLVRLRVGERAVAADADDEIGIVEVHRPLLAGADDQRRDPRRLELLHGAEKVVPALDVLGLHAGLGEQLLVVVENDFAHFKGTPTALPSTLKALTAVGDIFASTSATSAVTSLSKPALSCACMTPPPQL